MASLDRALVRASLIVAVLCAGGSVARAQAPAAEPALRRWLDLQTLTVAARYHVVENSADVTTADQVQYREVVRARVNLDQRKRFTVTVGAQSGRSFVSGWLPTGAGTGAFDGSDHRVRQLFASAAPLKGIELQYGGLYLLRGEHDELTSYDDDGYVVGERLSVRRPKALWLDEVSLTRGAIVSTAAPSVFRRWDGLTNQTYTQALGSKTFSKVVTASLDYTRATGADTIRGAVTVHLPKGAPVQTVRYEQYRRVNHDPASGFAVWADRTLGRLGRLQAGYIAVDQHYGGLNSDRALSGRRVFANLVVPIYGPLSATLFTTHAVDIDYPVAIAHRSNIVVTWDVLSSLRRTGVF